MKNTIKTLAVLFLAITLFSCDNDDSNNPAPNTNQCNYQGLTFDDNANNVHTLIPEADLTTDFFPNNYGPGQPAVEIYKTADGGNQNIVTSAVTLNAVDTNAILTVNGTPYTVTVTCQRAGSAVGDELRLDVTASGVEAEYCVVIDSVIP